MAYAADTAMYKDVVRCGEGTPFQDILSGDCNEGEGRCFVRGQDPRLCPFTPPAHP